MRISALKLIRLEVMQEDIDEMIYRYNSGMADRTTANAIALALRKKMRRGMLPRIVSAPRHHACRVLIGKEWFPLPQKIYGWLNESNRGKPVAPDTFGIVLPEDVLLPQTLATGEPETAIAA